MESFALSSIKRTSSDDYSAPSTPASLPAGAVIEGDSGNIQVFENMGCITIAANTVNGNLQFKANSLAPVGGNNIVQDNQEDQCAGL
jgi:hypothetical protein